MIENFLLRNIPEIRYMCIPDSKLLEVQAR